jgi:hypothetical protein
MPQVGETLLGRNIVRAWVYSRDPPAGGLQTCEVADLMLDAAPGNQVDLRVHSDWLGDQSSQGRQLEANEVLAGQETDQVCCGKDGLARDELHHLSRYRLSVTGRMASGH